MPQDWFIRRGQITILPGKNLFPADSLAHLQIMVQESREPERSQWTTVLGGTRRNFQKHPARTQKSLSNKERLDLGRLRLRIVSCWTEGEILQQQTSAVRKVRSKTPNQKLS